MCGPPPMIDAATVVLKQKGIDETRIYFDKF
jgi:ferredoxin-NADP reductase